jgi:[ribosomal protein S18]-alanine N-acetyltransferase
MVMSESLERNADGYRIRDYRPGDFAALDALWREVGMATPGRGDTEEVVERTLKIDGARLLVLEDAASGDMIGASWITNDGRRLYLHHFAVKPSHQGRGLSKVLLRASLEHACAAGLQIKLEVARNNERAVGLYRKAGFKSLGDYEVYILRDVRGA